MKKFMTLCMLVIAQAIFITVAAQSGKICFTSSTIPDVVSAKIEWTSNPDNTITIKTTFSKTFVDNTYGVNAIGWGTKGHTFGNLVGSDHLQLALFDTKGVKKLEFKLDYITSSSTVPSGYKTLGVTGGEGQMIVGSATNVVGARTSISENLNTFGYVLTTNSPSTTPTYTPNPAYPNWIYDVWYEVTVNASAFGADGFGAPSITGVHASPSKTGNNTEIVIPGPCNNTLRLGNLVFNDRNGSGIRDAGEPAIPGVTVNLYKADNFNMPLGGIFKTTVTDAKGNYLFDNLPEGKYIASLPIPTGYGQSPNSITGRIGAPANGQSLAPDNNIDNDNNLVRLVGLNVGGVLFTNSISLNYNVEPDVAVDGDDKNGNLTFDLAVCGNTNIGDFVFKDLNADGLQDVGDLGIANVKVSLTFPDGTMATTTTDAGGIYHFMSIGPGTYQLAFTNVPAGLYQSPANQGPDDLKDSDPIDGVAMITVAANPPGAVDNSFDAGFNDKVSPTCISLSLGNMVFFDKNKNGVKDSDEKPLDGVTVNLYRDFDGDNVPDGAAISSVVTVDGGLYYFSNLIGGKYIVGVVPPAKYTLATGGNANPNDDINGDNNGVTLTGGEVRTNDVLLMNGTEPVNDGSDNNSNLTIDIGLAELKAREAVSPIRQVQTLSTTTMKVYPNPANNNFSISVYSPERSNAVIRLIDINGRLVMAKNTTVNAGTNTININDASKLKSGSYQVQLLVGNEKLNSTLILAK